MATVSNLETPPAGESRPPAPALALAGLAALLASSCCVLPLALALAGISGGRGMLSQGRAFSALKEDTSMEGVAGAALWLLSDLGRSTTGEVVHVDAGFHMVGLPDGFDA